MKFDYIIGNPPFNRNGIVSKTHGKYFTDIGKTKSGTKAFIMKGIDLLKKDGSLLYVIPTGWMCSLTSDKIRYYMLSNGSIKSIGIYDRTVFPTVTIPGRVCILHYTKNYLNTIKITQTFNNALYDTEIGSDEVWLKDRQVDSLEDCPPSCIPLYFGDIGKNILNKVLNKGNTFNEEKIFRYHRPFRQTHNISNIKNNEFTELTVIGLDGGNSLEYGYTRYKFQYEDYKVAFSFMQRDETLIKKGFISGTIVKNCNVGKNILYYIAKNKDHAELLKMWLESKLFLFCVIQLMDIDNASERSFGLMTIPENTNFYEYYNITSEEIKYITETI